MKFLILIVSLFPLFSFAGSKIKFKESKGKTEFLAVGNPGFLKINGHGEGPAGFIDINDNTLNGEFEIQIESLDTGMKLRNTHMKEKYLEVEKYPKAILKIINQKISSGWTPDKFEIKSQKIMGVLEVHGKSKNVELEYGINSSGLVSAEFKIKITDFEIEIPSFMGVTVADTVTVKVSMSILKSETLELGLEPKNVSQAEQRL